MLLDIGIDNNVVEGTLTAVILDPNATATASEISVILSI